MKVGALFYPTAYTIDPTALARALEAAGFESLWVPEHAALPVLDKPHPVSGGPAPAIYGQKADPFVALSFAAAATTTLKLATGVCVFPEHHPLLLAKTVATLDRYSGGRVILGAGVGYQREEIELFGTDFGTRWKYARETAEAMRALWRTGRTSYDGDLVRFPTVLSDPTPTQRPGPRIVLGGGNTAHTYRRVAAWGDGWFAASLSPDEAVSARSAISGLCERAGRDPASIELSVCVEDVDEDILDSYTEAGVDRLVVSLYNHPGDPIPHDRWREAMIAAHLGPSPTAADTLRAVDLLAGRIR